MNRSLLELHGLAADLGVSTAYRDMNGRLRVASADALVAVLRAVGAPLDRIDDAAGLRRELAARRTVVEPVSVAWGGRFAAPLRLPVAALGPVEVSLTDEAGTTRLLDAHVVAAGAAARLRLDEPLPEGLFTIRVEARGDAWETFAISAPVRATAPAAERAWGAFLPLHAFGVTHDRAMTYRELGRAAGRLRELGAAFVGTLPLLAAFLEHPFEPSPYAPASRLFWNDLFVDLGEDPARHRAEPRHFDYAAAEARLRPRLQAAADAFFENDPDDAEFQAFLAANPDARDYARFRAACDRFGSGFGAWPEPARSGTLGPDDGDEADVRRHLFGAFLADRQLAAGADAARAASAAALYIDLPLGVHDQGYDVWRWPDLFAAGVSAGAPPDALFRGGQDWGFRPLTPAALRASRYEYLVRVLRHHMRHAGALRIDHVMSLVRLFWVPHGFPATEGIYVRYPREELLALLVLESRRHDTLLIGEDLGTVPEEVRTAMDARGLLRMFVLQFALGGSTLPPVPARVAASLNTHDTPSFAGFWRGADIEDQRELGLIDDARAAASRAARERLRARVARAAGENAGDVTSVLRALLRHLAAGDADLLLVTLEDLWAEPLPQNVPGTSHERPNWRRRSRTGIQDALQDPEIVRLLRDLDQLRSAETPDARP